VALLAQRVRGVKNSEVIFCGPGLLSATPLTYCLRRNHGNYVVLCFSNPEDAVSFAKRFGGRSCWKYPENKRGDPKAAP
jgi:hypothetical protein